MIDLVDSTNISEDISGDVKIYDETLLNNTPPAPQNQMCLATKQTILTAWKISRQ